MPLDLVGKDGLASTFFEFTSSLIVRDVFAPGRSAIHILSFTSEESLGGTR